MFKRVLGVAAHPDDLEWYAGATMARLVGEGTDVTFVLCTNGDKGSFDATARPVELSRQRQEEQRAAARYLGIRGVVFLDYPDGELTLTLRLREQLARLYRQQRPELLLAFDPWKEYEMHPDHLAAGRAALDARIAAKMPLYHPEMASEGLDAWAIPELWLFNANSPNHYMNVTATLETQLRALAHHTSQPSVWDNAARRFVIDNAKENGARVGVTYAEAFRRIVIEGALVLAQGVGST